MYKQTIAHPSVELLSINKERTTDTWNNMDESQMHYVEWKEQDPKELLSFIWHSRIHNSVRTKTDQWMLGTESGAKGWLQIFLKELGGVIVAVYLVVAVTQPYAFVRTQRTVKYFSVTVSKLSLNENMKRIQPLKIGRCIKLIQTICDICFVTLASIWGILWKNKYFSYVMYWHMVDIWFIFLM